MNKTSLLLIFVVWLLPLFVSATEVNKEDWISGMTTAVPTEFCNKNQYFRQCFDVTAQECEETVASATRVCLNKNNNKIPDVLANLKMVHVGVR